MVKLFRIVLLTGAFVVNEDTVEVGVEDEDERIVEAFVLFVSIVEVWLVDAGGVVVDMKALKVVGNRVVVEMMFGAFVLVTELIGAFVVVTVVAVGAWVVNIGAFVVIETVVGAWDVEVMTVGAFVVEVTVVGKVF